MHKEKAVVRGRALGEAEKVLIMLHGRGASSEDILSLSAYLPVKDFTLIAPQATNQTWYPFSFLSPVEKNEPWLSSAIILLNDLLKDIAIKKIDTANVYFLGFSQGACLALEFVARNAIRYGGVIAFTGGLIGDKINPSNYSGDFKKTPVFIGSSNPDPHVPVERVYATSNILKNMNALVTEKIYNNMGHTINQDEIDTAIATVFAEPPAH